MLGPSENCMEDYVTYVLLEMRGFMRVVPNIESVSLAETVIEIQDSFASTFSQMKSNLQLGIRVGMMHSRDTCVSGAFCAAAVLQNCLYSKYNSNFSRISTAKSIEAEHQWMRVHKQTISESTIAAQNRVVQACSELIHYLSNEYKRHCPNSTDDKSLAQLPIDHIYVNLNPVNHTTKMFPTGEVLNGSKMYQRILSYHLTEDVMPGKSFDGEHFHSDVHSSFNLRIVLYA